MCELIITRRPTFIFLQEVVQPVERGIIIKRLGESYLYFAPEPRLRYYVAILVHKSSSVSVRGHLEVTYFPHSQMGRHLLHLPVSYCGVDIDLFTSHLESEKKNGKERCSQLVAVFKTITELQKQSPKTACIFGGDLNVRDHEVTAVGLPPHTVDVWEECGSSEEHIHTYVVLRLDRIYLSSCDGRVRANSFSLVGKQRLPECGRFPSDHWGVWSELEVLSEETK